MRNRGNFLRLNKSDIKSKRFGDCQDENEKQLIAQVNSIEIIAKNNISPYILTVAFEWVSSIKWSNDFKQITIY